MADESAVAGRWGGADLADGAGFRHICAFVDGAVTIVVESVACFASFRARHGVAICSGAVVFADEFSGTGADAEAVGAVLVEIAEAVVDGSVAIVVFVVATFDGRQDFAAALGPLTVGAALSAWFAEADVLGGDGAGVGASPLRDVVHLAVAVVILLVAEFCLRGDFADAAAPSAGLTVLEAVFAEAFAGGSAGAGVAGFGLEAFIYLTVAGVVSFVAGFGFCGAGSGVASCSGTVLFTDEFSGLFAFACAGVADDIQVWEVFICFAVTVFVAAVAGFLTREDHAVAWAPGFAIAGLTTQAANADADLFDVADVAGAGAPLGADALGDIGLGFG